MRPSTLLGSGAFLRLLLFQIDFRNVLEDAEQFLVLEIVQDLAAGNAHE